MEQKVVVVEYDVIDVDAITLDMVKTSGFAKGYVALKEGIDRLSEDKKKIDAQVKNLMRDEYLKTGERTIKQGGLTISFVDSSFRDGFDLAAFKLKHPDLYEEFKTTSVVSDSVRFTVKKEKGDE